MSCLLFRAFAGSAMLLACVASAQTVAWQPARPASTPPWRGRHATVYDALRDRVVLYGGAGRLSTVYRETWAWDGAGWTQLGTQRVPGGPLDPGMAYDRARDRVVLFGGKDAFGKLSPDTWEFDGAEWHRATPPDAPPARRYPELAYHAGTGCVVLFGGGLDRDDTWLWDGVTCTEVPARTRPEARIDHVLAYDRARDVVVLCGGLDGKGAWLSDTWEFDGARWTRIQARGAPGGPYHWMAADPDRGTVLLYWTNAPYGTEQMWEYDGTGWTPRPLVQYAGVHAPDMAYHEGTRRMVAFGDYMNLPGTWELVTLRPPDVRRLGAGCSPAGTAALARDPHEWPWLGGAFRQDVTASPSSLTAFLVLGLSDTQLGSAPLPLSLAPFGVPGCSLRVSAEWIAGYPMHGGRAPIAVRVPPDPRLLATTLFEQALVHDPSLPPAFTATDAFALRIGSRW